MERPQFILFIEPGRPDMPGAPTDEERKLVGEHFDFWKSQLEVGNVVLVGRTQEAPFVGIAIFEADDIDAAKRIVESDPGIAAGVFKVSGIQPYRVALMRT